MRIEELATGTPITFLVNMNGKTLSFDSSVQAAYPQRQIVLAEAVYRDGKAVSLEGDGVVIDVLVASDDDKPLLFRKVGVKTLKKADNTYCYALACRAEGKPYNRRQNFRCFIGLDTSIQLAPGGTHYNAVIRDVSLTGFSIACDQNLGIQLHQTIHASLRDRIDELYENYSFELHGTVVRVEALENGKFIYGCRLNQLMAGLESYIMKKERMNLRKNKD